MIMNDENAKIELQEALEHLRASWMECEVAFGNAHLEDINQYILGSTENNDVYPFPLSFGDMNVVEWIDGAIDRLNIKNDY